MQVVRNFNHRAYGEIGRVVLESDVKVIKLNGKPIAATSVEYLLNFALQSLQDAYAGSENADEAKASFAKKLDAIVDGTLGMRSGGGTDEVTRIARQIVRGLYKTQLGAKSEAWAEFTGLSDDAQNAKLDELFAKNEAKLRPLVDEKIADLKKERERKAKLAATIEL